MSIDPNKAFGMKACNKTYTLEFRRDAINGTTEVTAVDGETHRMSFGQKLAAAWGILTGKTRIGDMVFPIQLRNSDFYHMSYIYRPEKKVEVATKNVDVKVASSNATKPAKKKATPAPTAETPALAPKPKKARKPKAKPANTENTAQ